MTKKVESPCYNCGRKSSWREICPWCGYEASKARVNPQGTWKLIFCSKPGCGCFYANPAGVCPTHGTVSEEPVDDEKTPVNWPPSGLFQ